MQETCALEELHSRFSDLREVSFRVTSVHPVVTWHAPVLPLNKEKMILMQWLFLSYIFSHTVRKEPSIALADSNRDVIWCLRASSDMWHEIEVLSVCSPTEASEEDVAGSFYV